MHKLIQQVRSAAMLGQEAALTDGELLDSYVSQHEEHALEAIARRHAKMVWGVCRRVLSDHHDAEDAFQATFLVLVRKAALVYPSAKIGNWLYGVARRPS